MSVAVVTVNSRKIHPRKSGFIVLAVLAFSSLLPFLWVLVSSFKNTMEIQAEPLGLPKVWQYLNYREAWINGHLGKSFMNSVFVSGVSVLLVVLFSAMASYIIVRYLRSGWLYLFFTVGIMIPIQSILIPVFIILKFTHLNNSHPGLIFVYAAGYIPLSIFILVAFLRTFPIELEEAAHIDGASRSFIFFSIVLPLSKPGLSTIGTLAFLNCWNEYLYAFIILSKQELRVLTQGIYALIGQYATRYGALCAGLVIGIVPVMFVFFLFQEQVMKGMTAGAVKG